MSRDNKTARFQLRYTPAQQSDYKTKAKACGMSVAEWILMICDAAAISDSDALSQSIHIKDTIQKPYVQTVHTNRAETIVATSTAPKRITREEAEAMRIALGIPKP
jgi:hypothetical protein